MAASQGHCIAGKFSRVPKHLSSETRIHLLPGANTKTHKADSSADVDPRRPTGSRPTLEPLLASLLVLQQSLSQSPRWPLQRPLWVLQVLDLAVSLEVSCSTTPKTPVSLSYRHLRCSVAHQETIATQALPPPRQWAQVSPQGVPLLLCKAQQWVVTVLLQCRVLYKALALPLPAPRVAWPLGFRERKLWRKRLVLRIRKTKPRRRSFNKLAYISNIT